MKAIWNKQIIAQSEKTVVLENNHYFPRESVSSNFLHTSDHQSSCFWKGQASYFHLVVDGEINENAAWYYPEPKNAAARIRNYVAFWKGVEIIRD